MYRPKSAANVTHAKIHSPVTISGISAAAMLALSGCVDASGAFGGGDPSSMFYHNDNTSSTSFVSNCLDDDNLSC